MKKIFFSLLFKLLALSAFAESPPPNIVFIMTDDQRWDNFGCYGRPEFQTKNIDQLSAEGVTFDSAYYAVSICMPSRVTAMTGRYYANHRSGFTYPYNIPMTADDLSKSYPALLKKAGYRTGFVGKFGYRIEGGKDGIGMLKEHFDYFDAGGGHTNFGGGQWADDPKAFKNLSKGRKVTERTIKKGDSAIRFLETHKTDKPFVLSISFDAVKNDKDKDMHVPDKKRFEKTQMTVPGNYYEGHNPNLPEVVRKNARGVPLHIPHTGTPARYQNLVRRFAAQGVTVDNQVARIKQQLQEMGVLNNTVIIYTSDNGRYQGSHGLHDKCLLHEESVKAPLIIWDGRGMERKGQRENLLTSSVDIAPTIMSLAGVEIPDSVQGVPLTGLINNTADRQNWRDAVLMENLFLQEILKMGKNPKNKKLTPEELNKDIIKNNRSYRSRGVRTEKWKYFVYYEHTPKIEELYDLDADPLEQNNLAASSEHQETLRELREKTEELYNKFKKK